MNKIKEFFDEKYIIVNKCIIYFLILSMSLFLSTDFFPIIEVCLVIVAIYLLFYCYMKKFKPIVDFIKSPFFIWYILFWLFVAIVTFLRNEGQLIGLIKTIIVFTSYIFGFGILYIDEKVKEKLNIYNMMEEIAVFLSIWILIWDFQLLIQGKRIGYSVMIGNPNAAGTLLSIYIFFIVYKTNQSANKKELIKHILALILCFFVILMTGSKKSIIMTAISFLLFLFKNGKFIWKRLIYFCIIGVIVAVSCFAIPVLYQNVGRRFLSLFGELGIIEFQSDYSSEARVEYSELALELWRKNPIIGGGYDNFRVNSGYDTYSHNNYTELLSDVGLVGLIIYYAYYIILLKKNIRIRNIKSIMSVLFIIATLITDVGAVTFSIYPTYYIMLIIMSDNFNKKTREEIIDAK